MMNNEGFYNTREELVPVSKLSITGFILSIIQFFTIGILSPLSMIFSIAGTATSTRGRKRGKGFGIAGIIMSSIGLCLLVFFIFAVILSAGTSRYISKRRAREEEAKQHYADMKEAIDNIDTRSGSASALSFEKDFGSYDISADWVEAEDSPGGIYYCHEGDEDAAMPNNIKVFHDKSRYSEDDVLAFKDAINAQLLQQTKDSGSIITGSGSTTSRGYTLLTFEILPSDEDDGAPYKCVQYYIVGDCEYVMVSLMIWDMDKDASEDHSEECAEKIVNSFEWD